MGSGGQPVDEYVLSGTTAWDMASAVNHELCHLLGLDHPFQGISTCADAPVSANCWNLNQPATADCNAWNKVSNNLMDYNANQSSLSPCQVGIIQNNLNTCLQSRYVYTCSDCEPTIATFELPASSPGAVNIWLDGRATWNCGSYKLEIDRVEVVNNDIIGTRLVSGTHYEAINYRALGRERLDAIYPFLDNHTYWVRVTTYTPNGCGASMGKGAYITLGSLLPDSFTGAPRPVPTSLAAPTPASSRH